jgi:aminomethyltransferase
MPLPTPFHERTRELCVSYKWKDWAGYHAVCVYGLSPEREYNAIRQGAALLDVTPLYKYEIRGADAAAFLSYLTVRDVAVLKPGRMTYLCWCDDDGKVIDDGTCARIDDDHFRLTAAAPAFHWLSWHAESFDVRVDDVSDGIAALALQGPTSREVLRAVCDADVDSLRFFGVAPARFARGSGWVSRTGYTGDLGYELWVPNDHALALWDALMSEGKNHGLVPTGLDALDISRVEAGFVLRGVDYVGANEALIEAQKSSPYEIGLGWTVKLDERPPFIGQGALTREHKRGNRWSFVGLDIDWQAIESLYDHHGLPPDVPTAAWRSAVPVYHEGHQVGRATSGSWSPILKKNLALATVEAELAHAGTELFIECTVEWTRQTVPAVVRALPFFDPERKRSNPALDAPRSSVASRAPAAVAASG